MVIRKEAMEKIGGYDERLGYGEDADKYRKAVKNGLNIAEEPIDGTIYFTFVEDLQGVFRQGMWYGKGFIPFFRKHPKELTSLLSFVFFLSVPFMAILSLFSWIIAYLFTVQLALIGFYIAIGVVRTKTLYMLLVPLVKIVRSVGEAVGIIKSFYTEDLGRD